MWMADVLHSSRSLLQARLPRESPIAVLRRAEAGFKVPGFPAFGHVCRLFAVLSRFEPIFRRISPVNHLFPVASMRPVQESAEGAETVIKTIPVDGDVAPSL